MVSEESGYIQANTNREVKFPITIYVDVTKVIEKKVVPVRTEVGEVLGR